MSKAKAAVKPGRTKTFNGTLPRGIKASQAVREGLINSPQMRDTIALCRGFIHAADVR
ncbi:hypothetical protein [Xanthomonas citri]|uniref:hypothetical protein n=1 Tax=Xanthomonas citri TaxID=346 RepID=UPI0012FF3FE5|nr:hypothetical protein [Xanthomonas citri]